MPTAATRVADLPASARASSEVELRYEDVAEDGRMKLEALPHFMGVVCWRELVMKHPRLPEMRDAGVVPILSRLVLTGTPGPLSVRNPVRVDGGYQVAATTPDARGETRLVLNLLADVTGVADRTHGPPPDNAGAHIAVGTVFAEHVFTRPFAPADTRKVTRLPEGAFPEPYPTLSWVTGESLLAPPDGAPPLAPWAPSGEAVTFGLTHTDSNFHVNSLVYPQSFEEAVIARLVSMGASARVLLRDVELRFRKPCFAGDRVRWHTSLAREGARIHAAATLRPAGDPGAAPYCFVRGVLD